MDERFENLRDLCSELEESTLALLEPTLENIAFLENQLDELRLLPQIRFNPKDPSQQKVTPAAKMYKENLQQYNNCIKIVLGVLGKADGGDKSPLREYLEGLMK